MLGSVKYQIEGSKWTIETGVTPKGQITRIPVSDFHFHYRDEKGSLIRIEILGIGKVARMEASVNFGEWGDAKKVKPAKEKKSKANAKKQSQK